MGDSTASGLLGSADEVMSDADALPPGLWQHAAALLARKALEQAIAGMWKTNSPGLEDRPVRFQLLCLPTYVEANLAGRASHVWWSLTNACHHHPYELAPTAVELRGWLATVGDVIDGVQRANLRQ